MPNTDAAGVDLTWLHRSRLAKRSKRGIVHRSGELVPDDALRLDGEYVDLAWDWALMLPLVEVARSPRYIDDPLYLYEPSGVGKRDDERRVREEIIGRIVEKPSLRNGGAR
jgi:hypothetical protein